MSNHLKIIKLSGRASVQDLGRLNSQHLGFSAGGAADEYAFRFANSLLDNDQNHAALEITLGQIQLQAGCDCFIALTGADCKATISQQDLPTKVINNWQSHLLKKGQIITLHQPKKLLHSYIAVKGGIQSKIWLNSRSQSHSESNLGFTGKTLRTSDFITIDINQKTLPPNNKTLQRNSTPQSFYADNILTLRFIPNSLYLSLDRGWQRQFTQQTFRISADSNRMGYRLNGNIAAQTLASELSKPVNYGSIQIPNQGQPMILMKERQTIGGYPTLGTVMQTDLFRLSQKRPGEEVRFTPTTTAKAQVQLTSFLQRFYSL